MVNFEVSSSNSFEIFPKNHFVTVAEADIDDSIKRKRFRFSLNDQPRGNTCLDSKAVVQGFKVSVGWFISELTERGVQ